MNSFYCRFFLVISVWSGKFLNVRILNNTGRNHFVNPYLIKLLDYEHVFSNASSAINCKTTDLQLLRKR